jgi:hypothetical protein
MLQKIFGKMQAVFFVTANPVVCETCSCTYNKERETVPEGIAGFAREHGINYTQPMSRWMLGRGE